MTPSSKKKTTSGESLSGLKLAQKVAALAADKKAENIVILEMSETVNYCDYFVICSGTMSRHVKAIVDGVDLGLRDFGIKVRHAQGQESLSGARNFSSGPQDESGPVEWAGAWMLLDMGDVVVHVFEGSSREFFALDHLWSEAKQIPIK